MNKQGLINFLEWIQFCGGEVSLIFYNGENYSSLTRKQAEKLVEVYLEWEKKSGR